MHPRTLIACLTLAALPLGAQAPAQSDTAAKELKEYKLFKSFEPLDLRITSDFKQAFRSRDTLKVKRTPAVLSLADDDGKPVDIPIEISPRGHFRIDPKNCSFPPIKINVPKGAAKNTAFAGQGGIKFGTHCQRSDDYNQYVLREYLAYRAYNLITPYSLRARLARTIYVDAKDTTEKTARWGLLIESEDDLAKRTGGKILEDARNAVFDDLDQKQLNIMVLYEYFIGNTDFSVSALHNVRLLSLPTFEVMPVAYDFDWSGLVETRYSVPDARLPIKSTRTRLYRGPCRTVDEMKPTVDLFLSQRAAIDSLFASVPELDPDYLKSARAYINDFYETIGDPKKLKRNILDYCVKKAGV